MKRIEGIALGAVLLAGAGLGGTARAEEGVEKAVSIAASIGSERNDTVRAANGSASSGDGGTLGFSGMGSVGPVAVGVTGELSQSVNGIANRTAGGLAGARLPLGTRLRLLVLGEAGTRTFSDANEIVFDSTVTPDEVSLAYVGGRVGITWLVLEHFDLGVMAFARTDLGEGTMVVHQEPFIWGGATDTRHQVGGFAAGVALQIGFRFDTTRPFYDPVQRLVPKT